MVKNDRLTRETMMAVLLQGVTRYGAVAGRSHTVCPVYSTAGRYAAYCLGQASWAQSPYDNLDSRQQKYST